MVWLKPWLAGDGPCSYSSGPCCLVLFKRGKLKEALEPLKKAAEHMKSELERRGSAPDATIFEHLGDVYFQLQQLEQASDAWRQAAKAAAQVIPPDKRLTEIRKKIESLEKLGPVPKPAADRTSPGWSSPIRRPSPPQFPNPRPG